MIFFFIGKFELKEIRRSTLFNICAMKKFDDRSIWEGFVDKKINS